LKEAWQAAINGIPRDKCRFTPHGSYRRFGQYVNKLNDAQLRCHTQLVASRNLNGRIDGGSFASCFADEEVLACDALPPPLRALIKSSFVNTKATTVLEQWRDLERQGVPLEAYVDWFAAKLAINRAGACRATYGPDHPQARPPPLLGGAPPRATESEKPADPATSDSAARAARRAAQINLKDV
jgi:hypothetical protein